MAKLKNPLLSLSAFGRIAKSHTIRRSPSGHILENSPFPTNLRSPLQQSWRSMFQMVIDLWHGLSAAEQETWNTAARPFRMSRYNYFLSQALKPNPGIYLPLAGGTMQGAIDMDSNKIQNLPPPGTGAEAARKQEVTDHAASISSVHGLKGDHGFRVYLSTDQTIPDTTNTKVEYDIVVYDIGSYWNSANYRFIPQISGRFLFVANTRIKGLGDGKRLYAYLFKNGFFDSWLGSASVGSQTHISVPGTAIVSMNGTTDYVEVFVNHNHGANLDLYSGEAQTFFQCTLIPQT